MEEFSKNGRKLRPRKTSSGPAYSTSRDFNRERTNNSDRPVRAGSDRPQRSSYGDRPHHSNGGYQGQDHGNRRPYSDRSQGGNARKGGFNTRGNNARKFGKKPFHKREEFSRASQEGIDRMISRRPQVSDQGRWSDNDSVKSPIKEEVRLNKFIANSGVCSRREADTLIQAGVVTVNGVVVTELGTKVNVYKDEVRFNGERLRGEEKVYLVMNKPKGYVTTASDPHAEKTVMDLLKGCQYRVFPVGRLDKNTTGVLMFTNDGEIAERLTHPSYDKKKIYQVSLDKPLSEEDCGKILTGVTLSDGVERADELEYIDAEDHRKLGIEIHSGKNRIVRRIFESLGYEVRALDRVYFAGLTKKGLKKGEWRQLSEGEVNILKMGAYV
ncbi:MAG: pseudouridine synthase [Bacteroidales bacterium]|nr:pseudouridine synthase [Bacteroidales bacterium]